MKFIMTSLRWDIGMCDIDQRQQNRERSFVQLAREQENCCTVIAQFKYFGPFP